MPQKTIGYRYWTGVGASVLVTADGVAPAVVALPDGRALGWYEFGDRDGVPCLFHPGAATSGIAGLAFDATARDVGVRFIAIDRPGLGHSDPAPHRRLSDWAADVAALADHEGIGRFAVLGHSGGGSHALALAHGLPDRAVLTVVAAGLGPYEEPWLRRLLDARTRRYYWLIRHAEPLFRGMFALGFSDALDALAAKTTAVDPSTPDGRFYRRDPTTTRMLLAGNTAAARRGVRWPVQDLRVPLLPWGFGLEDVAGRVSWWHGVEDRNVSFASGAATAQRLPNCDFHPVIDAGHMVPLDHMTAVLALVRDSTA